MAGFQSVAAYVGFGLGILNAGLGVITLWRSRKEAVRKRQRELRGRLRDIALELVRSCDEINRGEREFISKDVLEDYLPRLHRVHDEGLLSPNERHVDRLEQLLREAAGLDQKENDLLAERARKADDLREQKEQEYYELHGFPMPQPRQIDWAAAWGEQRPEPQPFKPVVDPVIDQVKSQFNTVVSEIRSLADAYARAATRMDNGSFVAYLRWRWF